LARHPQLSAGAGWPDDKKRGPMKTIQEVRDRFDKLLMAHASPLEQIDAMLAEDGATVFFLRIPAGR
jgi:hypothetical protein